MQMLKFMRSMCVRVQLFANVSGWFSIWMRFHLVDHVVWYAFIYECGAGDTPNTFFNPFAALSHVSLVNRSPSTTFELNERERDRDRMHSLNTKLIIQMFWRLVFESHEISVPFGDVDGAFFVISIRFLDVYSFSKPTRCNLFFPG